MTDRRVDGPAIWARAVHCLGRALRERDRVWTWLSLIVFGAWSLSAPTPSLAVVPAEAQLVSYCGFILAGILGLIGATFDEWHPFVLGHLLATIGLLSASGVIAVRSGSPVAALLFGFATTMAYGLQRAMRERRVLERALADRPPGVS